MKLFYSCILLFLSGMIQAQSLSLDRILDTIRKNHAALKMFDHEISSMQEGSKAAYGWAPPSFSSGFYMTPYNPAMWHNNSMGGTAMGSYMISVEQMFPNRAEQNAQAKSMLSSAEVEAARKIQTLNQLYFEARMDFFAMIVLEKKQGILFRDRQLLELMIKDTEIRFRNGMGSLDAYYKAKAALSMLKREMLNLSDDLDQERIRLNTLMNVKPDAFFSVDTTYHVPDYSLCLFDTDRLAQRSPIEEINRQLEVSRLSVEVEKQKMKPQFGLKFDHSFSWNGQPWEFSLMGIVSLPLKWSIKRQRANIEMLHAEQNALIDKRSMLLNDEIGKAWGLRQSIMNRKQQIQIYETEILPDLVKNYSTIQIGYARNTQDLFHYFDAWETLYRNQMALLDVYSMLYGMQAQLAFILEIGLQNDL